MIFEGKPKGTESCMRRTASLDALYLRPSWSISASCTILQVDKSTQTEESFLDRSKGVAGGHLDVATDLKIEKVIRQRLQKTQRGEHSVSSQTLSPIHGKILKSTKNFNVKMSVQSMISNIF